MRRIFFALIAVFLAGPALATQDAWPALFDVRGVAADDVLNIRAEPSASAPIIGSLAHDARGVEVIAPNDRETWGRVNTMEGTGWVSLSFLERLPGQWDGAFPEIAACFGTEPFWSVSRQFGEISLSRLDAPELRMEERWHTGSVGRRDRFALRAESGGILMTALIQKVECSDGMSERLYGLEIDAIFDGNDDPMLLSGCCSLSGR